MQAHCNAMLRSDEYVMESFCTFDKIKILIYDLLMTEVWKENILPLMKSKLCVASSFRSYTSVYHEAVLCNLIEILFFHKSSVECGEEYLIDLIEYCYRKLVKIMMKFHI